MLRFFGKKDVSTQSNMRLPQDVGPPTGNDRRGVPDLSLLRENAAFYEKLHADALRKNEFNARAHASWGLVAQRESALEWIEKALESPNEDMASDAAGVLMWVGVPVDWIPKLRALADRLPDSERLDSLLQALPHDDSEGDSSQPHPGTEILFDGKLDAFTESIWFIDRGIEDAMLGIRKGHTVKLGAETSVKGNLKELLNRLEPWSMPSGKVLVVQTQGPWTAMFSQGSDVYYLDVAARYLHCRSLRTSYSPHVRKNGKVIRYGGRSFWFADHSAGEKRSRTIQASYQSRWQWDLDGEALPFEELELYGQKNIPERFDITALNRYCAALGIRRNDPTFYGPNAFIIEPDISNWVNPPRTMSSQQWLAEHSN